MMIDREELREYLSSVYDLERLITKITYQSANPRDLIAFKQSIGMLTPIKTILNGLHSRILCNLNDDIDRHIAANLLYSIICCFKIY